MNKRLVTIGDLVVDLLLDARLPVSADQHQTARSLQFEAGGACTTILAARGMGLEVAALGAVGDDFQGRMLLDILDDADVDTSALLVPPGSTSTTVLALTDTARGEHVFLGHYGEGPRIDLTEPAGALLDRADAVFIPGYTLVEERMTGLVAAVFDRLPRIAARLYLDAGPFMEQLSQARVDHALRAADVLLLTEAEIPFTAAGEAGAEACRRLCQRFPSLTIVLKLAEAGCHIMSRHVDLTCPGFAVDVLDTVGAGDAFAAAYIWVDLNGYSPLKCGTIANAMGAASVAKVGGGRNAPSRAEVQTVLDEQDTGIKLIC